MVEDFTGEALDFVAELGRAEDREAPAHAHQVMRSHTQIVSLGADDNPGGCFFESRYVWRKSRSRFL